MREVKARNQLQWAGVKKITHTTSFSGADSGRPGCLSAQSS
jgi:hypothetical protein